MSSVASETIAPGARMSLARRAALLALILVGETFALTLLASPSVVPAPAGFWGAAFAAQPDAARFFVAAAMALAVFAYAHGDSAGWSKLNIEACGTRMRPGWFAIHALVMVLLLPLSLLLYDNTAPPVSVGTLVGVRLLLAFFGVIALFPALAPWSLWSRAARKLGVSWLYALVFAAVATAAIPWLQGLWAPTAAITFDLVRHLLAPLISGLQADPHALILRSSRFSIKIGDLCSGLEGVGLISAFCGAWLLFYRREYVFPRALLLVPIGLALSFALNVVRIAVLMLIGYAGYPDVAVYGFHSQAGWIAFDCTAALLAVASQRSRWFCRTASDRTNLSASPRTEVQPVRQISASGNARWDHPTAFYLLPFLMMLGAGMVAHAISGSFDTFYVLGPIGAAIALALSWRRLRGLDWRFSWRGLLAGALVFAVWMTAARLLVAPAQMPAALAAMSVPERLLWLAVRAGAAVAIVPIAEELAFRGYLLRRLRASDFDAVRFREAGVTALLVSAVVFGLEHGSLWLPALIAGLVYGGLLMRTERMGEAVAAHASANALLAFAVLHGGQWQLW